MDYAHATVYALESIRTLLHSLHRLRIDVCRFQCVDLGLKLQSRTRQLIQLSLVHLLSSQCRCRSCCVELQSAPLFEDDYHVELFVFNTERKATDVYTGCRACGEKQNTYRSCSK